MFSDETEKLVDELIKAEYENACLLYGEKFANRNLALGVLYEEIYEVKKEWHKIKDISLPDFIEHGFITETDIDIVKNLIKEAAQVAAVMTKIRNSENLD